MNDEKRLKRYVPVRRYKNGDYYELEISKSDCAKCLAKASEKSNRSLQMFLKYFGNGYISFRELLVRTSKYCEIPANRDL